MPSLTCLTELQIGEVVGGVYAHSLAVLTDAAHMLSDVLSFVISLCAGTYALRASKASHTFGYHRAEVLGSMVSCALHKSKSSQLLARLRSNKRTVVARSM